VNIVATLGNLCPLLRFLDFFLFGLFWDVNFLQTSFFESQKHAETSLKAMNLLDLLNVLVYVKSWYLVI
jgi:hypothetical protein